MNTTIESLQALYVKNGGNLTDTYSDICGGAAVGNYTTIPDMVAACAKLNIGGGGGGAEKFVVTISDNSGITADKTFAEIKAAYDADKDVEASIYLGVFGLTIKTVLSFVNADTAEFVGVVYSPLDTKTRIYSCYCYTGGGSDAWNSNNVVVDDIPSYSSSQNGKVLGVSSGSLAWVDSNAPLIVTLTAGSEAGQFVGDKTYKEVYDAFMAGQNCILNVPDTHAALAVLSVGHETGYTINASNEILATGSANDYVTITVGG